MRETRWKCIFRAKFLAQGFVVRALMPQGWVGSPNHSVFLNNLLVSLIYCESLKEIGEMACVTPARSSRRQTYRCSFQGTISYFSFRAQWLANDTAPPTFFMFFESNSSRKIQRSFSFINHGLYKSCYSLTIWSKISRAFRFCASCQSDRVLSTPVLMHWPTLSLRWSFLFSK